VRGIVLKESLAEGTLPLPFPAVVTGRYPHLLERVLPVEVIELTVARARAAQVALQLAGVLLPRLFYAHLVDDADMIVIFPRCIVQIPRGDEEAAETARRVGTLFGIPRQQMRFLEMFTTDHPDSAPDSAPPQAGRA
jgi:hypothetical protein